MDSITIIAFISIITAGLTMAMGAIGPAFAEGRAVDSALKAIAQQPDATSGVMFIGPSLSYTQFSRYHKAQ